MILCPYCNHEEFVGAIFCSECGEQFLFPQDTSTASIHSTPEMLRDYLGNKFQPSDKSPSFKFSTGEFMALIIMDSGEIIPIRGDREITLGRSGEGQPIIPDIDLAPYHGYENGVSRLHASIQILEQEITVTDLGAANGTRVNNKKIASHSTHPIKHGDILTLGKLKIQILLRV